MKVAKSKAEAGSGAWAGASGQDMIIIVGTDSAGRWGVIDRQEDLAQEVEHSTAQHRPVDRAQDGSE